MPRYLSVHKLVKLRTVFNMNNSWNGTDRNEDMMKTFLTTVSAVSSFFGVPANLLSIGLILRAKQKKSTTTHLLLNLALADVINLLSVLVIALVFFVKKPSFDTIMALFAMTTITKNVANLTLSFIALERYNALVRTTDPILVLTRKKNVIRTMSLFWFVGLTLHLPMPIKCLVNNESIIGKGTGVLIYMVFCNAFAFILPLLVSLFCYGKILKGVFHDRTILGKNAPNEAELKERKRIVRIMLLITVVFLVCNLPTILIKITKKVLPEQYLLIMYQMSCVSSAVNPYIYGLQSEKYRDQVKKLFCHRKTNTARTDGDKCQDSHF